MKKRFITIITAAALAVTAMPSTAHADDLYPELAERASSLGADEHFPYLPGAYCDSSDYSDAMPSLLTTPYSYVTEAFVMSVLEALVHNGDLSPADIQAGAESLADITKFGSVLDTTGELSSKWNSPFLEMQFGQEYCRSTRAERVQELLECADASMSAGKYFIVTLMDERCKTNQSLVGLGVAEGSYTFDGVTYDKCVLTLDPAFPLASTSGTPVYSEGFHELRCIYVNSQTGEWDVPGLRSTDSENSSIMLILDADEIAKYSSGGYTSDDSVKYLNYCADSSDGTLTIEHGSEKLTGSLSELFGEGGLLPNAFTQYLIEGTASVYTAIDRVSFSERAKSVKDLRRGEMRSWVLLKSADARALFRAKGELDGSMTLNGMKLTRCEPTFTITEPDIIEENEEYTLTLEQLGEAVYKFRRFELSGWTSAELSFEVTADGVSISDTGTLKAALDYCGGDAADDAHGSIRLSAEKPITLRYNDTEQKWEVYFSGAEETQVQTGDVNCDGLTDGVDASLILRYNADSTAGGDAYLTTPLADLNGDGLIDSLDASLLLAANAQES
ncbi:MAG: hypothetical protein IJM44_06130 [Ruminococcus sp.]|nr:hypothetical protein [Ruminococcus sp.]